MFLSGVASVTHLVYAAAYLRHLLADDGRQQVTVVDLGTSGFLGVSRVSPADVAAHLPDDRRMSIVRPAGLHTWRAERGEEIIYLAVGAPGVKPLSRLLVHNRRRVRCVVVDEGLGSYGGWRTRWAAGRREGKTVVRATVRALTVATSRRRLVHEHWPLYVRTSQGWDVDARIASEFRRQLHAKDDPQPGVVVVLSQPWVELGILSADRYLGVLTGVLASCADAGYSAVVRPHPAEAVRRLYGLPLAHDSGPAELDRSVTQARAVLGFSSSALVNLAALYGTPVLRIAVPELDRLDVVMSDAQRSLMAAFLPAPIRLVDLAAAVQGLPGDGTR